MADVPAPELTPELRSLFHRLNNQLGIILAHAELLEAKASTEMERTRAGYVVTSVLDAMTTTGLIRREAEQAASAVVGNANL